MKERDCANCKHHTSDGCSSWDCEFEKAMTREEAIERLNIHKSTSVFEDSIAEAIDMAIEALADDKTDRPTGLKLFEKIIVSHNTKGKPYYDIQYFDTEDGTHHIGYGSYNIQIIAKYLITYFSDGRPTGE